MARQCQICRWRPCSGWATTSVTRFGSRPARPGPRRDTGCPRAPPMGTTLPTTTPLRIGGLGSRAPTAAASDQRTPRTAQMLAFGRQGKSLTPASNLMGFAAGPLTKPLRCWRVEALVPCEWPTVTDSLAGVSIHPRCQLAARETRHPLTREVSCGSSEAITLLGTSGYSYGRRFRVARPAAPRREVVQARACGGAPSGHFAPTHRQARKGSRR